MAPSAFFGVASATSEPLNRAWRGYRAVPSGPQARRRLSIDAAVLTGTTERDHQSTATPNNEGIGSVVQLYNSARSKVSGAAHSLYQQLASKLPSYPDLAALLPHSPFWMDSPTANGGAPSPTEEAAAAMHASAETEAYAGMLSQALSQPLLMPFIERADRIEVQYASLLADLSNMAYEANKVRCGHTRMLTALTQAYEADEMRQRLGRSSPVGKDPISTPL